MIPQGMLDYVREFIESQGPIGSEFHARFPFRKLYGHCVRCASWARRLSEAEGGDSEICELSAFFHDIGKAVTETKAGHAETGADICDEYLKSIDFDPDKRERVVSIVRNHNKHAPEDNSTIEEIIESDADLLDEVGALTAVWDAMAEGAQEGSSFRSAYERIKAGYEGLASKPIERYHTEAARKIARGRIDFLKAIVDNLGYEFGLNESPQD